MTNLILNFFTHLFIIMLIALVIIICTNSSEKVSQTIQEKQELIHEKDSLYKVNKQLEDSLLIYKFRLQQCTK